MAKYELRFKQSVTKDLRAIPRQELTKILNRIETLAENPRGTGCVKLSTQERYRVRQGLYRIVYEIIDTQLVVIVIKVAHRSKVYK